MFNYTILYYTIIYYSIGERLEVDDVAAGHGLPPDAGPEDGAIPAGGPTDI